MNQNEKDNIISYIDEQIKLLNEKANKQNYCSYSYKFHIKHIINVLYDVKKYISSIGVNND